MNGPAGARKVRMHQLIMGSEIGDEVDHVRDPATDNRRCNLRFCAPRNQQNTEGRGGASRFKGVSWVQSRAKWRVAFLYEGRHHFVGYFVDELEAARAYDAAVMKAAGAFARPNFPELVTYSVTYKPDEPSASG